MTKLLTRLAILIAIAASLAGWLPHGTGSGGGGGGGGGGVATFDPGNVGVGNVLSNSNLTATQNATGPQFSNAIVRAVTGVSTGQYYFEYTINELANYGLVAVGIANVSLALNSSGIGQDTAGNSIGLSTDSPNALFKGAAVGTVPVVGQTNGHTVGVAVNFNTKMIWFRDTTNPNTWNGGGSANPATGVGGISFATLNCPCYAAVSMFDNIAGIMTTANYGQTGYLAAAPSGFINWPGNGGTPPLPVISVPGPQAVTQSTLTPVPSVSVADAGVSVTSVSVTLTDTNGLLSATGVGVTGSGTNNLNINSNITSVNQALGTLSLTNGTVGSDPIVINAVDNLGNNAAQQTISVTVNPGSAPLITVPGAQSVTVNTATPITGVSISDPGGGVTSIAVTLTDTNGNLSATGTGVSGSGTHTLVINSTVANVNTALGTLSFNSSITGSDSIVVSAVDNLGNHASQQTIPITVNSAGATNFYFSSSTGNDSNACTQALPCQTITKANTLTYAAGSTLNFLAGDTFTTATALTLTNSNVIGALTVTTYGGGTCAPLAGTISGCATIQVSGALAGAVNVSSIGHVTIQNLRLLGGTAAAFGFETGFGLQYTNGSTNQSNVTIQNLEVQNFSSGIYAFMGAGTLSNVNILNNYVHGSTLTSTADKGIWLRFGMTNVVAQGNLVQNIGGHASGAYAGGSGNGILLSDGVNGALDQFNVTTANGANITTCGGPAGNWTYNSTNINIQFNESYNNAPSPFTAGCDWDGFDLDGGVSGSLLQFNYSHGNYGAGYNLFQATVGGNVWQNNSVRYNVSEKDSSANNFGAISIGSSPGTNAASGVYNNTIYTHSTVVNSTTTAFCFNIFNTTNTVVMNNICYNDNGNVFITSAGTIPFNYNDYFRVGSAPANPWVYNGSNFASFAAWQTAGHDANGTTANPGLTNAGNGGTCYAVNTTPAGPQSCPSAYALTSGSAMVGIGQNLSASFTLPTRDYFGNTIPNGVGTGYNIGADGGSHPSSGTPVFAAPSAVNVSSGNATLIPGITLSETNTTFDETFTATVTDASGTLSAIGSTVVNFGPNSITIGPDTLGNINSALLTLKYNAPGNDTITLNAVDSNGNHAIPQTITVTALSGVLAKSANDFVNSIGFTTHLFVNPGLYTVANILAAKNYFGVNPLNIREYQYNAATAGGFNALGSSISAATIIFGSNCPSPVGNFDRWTNTGTAQWVAAFPTALRYLEGSNETNNDPICWQDSTVATATATAGSTTIQVAPDTPGGPFPMTSLAAIGRGTPGANVSYAPGVIVTDPSAGGSPNIDGGSQYAAEAQTGTPAAISVNQVINAPNELLVACIVSNVGPTQISDSLGLTWTKRASSITGGVDSGGSGVFPFQQEEWTAVGPSSGIPTTDIITDVQTPATAAVYPVNSYQALGVLGIINANTSSPFDGSAVVVNDPSQSSLGPMTISTTHANTAVLGCGRAGQSDQSAGTGFISPFAGFFSVFEYALFSSTQTNLSVDVTPTGGWQGSIADAIVLNGPPGSTRTQPIPANTTVVSSTPTSVTLNAALTGTGVLAGDVITFTANQARHSQPANPGACPAPTIDCNEEAASTVGWQAETYNFARYNGSPVANYPMLNSTNFVEGQPWNLGGVGASGTFNYNTAHSYPSNGGQPQIGAFNPAVATTASNAEGLNTVPGLPAVVTEGGYSTAFPLPTANGVDRTTQAILMVNFFLDTWFYGYPHTYTYELYDNLCNATDDFDAFGVFVNTGNPGASPPCDGSPKPAATALKNLFTIMSDSGSSFVPGALNYSVSGLPAFNLGTSQGGGYSFVVQKSNGNFYIVVWNEPPIWNNGSATEITPSTVPITINFGGTFATVNQYDPQIGSTPTASFSNVSSVNVNLVKDALVFELIGPGGGGGGGTSYFFSSSSGNDGNACTSSAAPCQTIAKLNSLSYPNGTTISLKAGDTFSAGTTLTLSGSNVAGALTLTTYGGGTCAVIAGTTTGCATLQATGSQAQGIAVSGNVGSLTIQNLRVLGNTAASQVFNSAWTAGAGIAYYGTGSNITIQNNEVNGFSGDIIMQGGGGLNNNVQILNNYVHGTTVTSADDVGIRLNAVTNSLVQGNLVRFIGGKSSSTSGQTGNGILINGTTTTGVIDQFNVTDDNGSNAPGGSGNWSIGAGNVTWQFNESYNQLAGGGAGGDGDGFNMNCGTQSSIMQFNFSHNNWGVGFQLATSNASSSCAKAWSNNQVRYNISEGDYYGWTGGTRGAIHEDNSLATGTNLVFNNTIYTHAAANSTSNGMCFGQMNGFTVNNNLCYNDSGNPFINSASGGGTFDYNDYFRTGATPTTQFLNSGCSAAAFSNWQTCGRDPHGLNVNPLISGVPPHGTCYTSGVPAGPQPCPNSTYQLAAGSPLTGVGVNLSGTVTLPTRDYFGGVIPNSSGTGYNIGADGHNPGGGGGGGTSFFFSNSTGSDSNACTSSAAPCQTIAKLNSLSYPNGSTISLKAGDTWSAGTPLTLCAAVGTPPPNLSTLCNGPINVQGSLSVTTYGGGTCNVIGGVTSGCATLQASGSQIYGVYAGGMSNFSIQNLRVLGNTSTTLATIACPDNSFSNFGGAALFTSINQCISGIYYTNLGIATSNITITNNEVNGYDTEIFVNAFYPLVLTSNVTLTNNYGHGTILSPQLADQEGFYVGGVQNSLIQGNLVANIAGNNTYVGGLTGVSGIVMGVALNSTYQFNVTHDNAQNEPQGAGNWQLISQGLTVQFNESYNQLAGNQYDGEGFDFDCGVSGSIGQYNYAHHNWGPGFMFYTAGARGSGTWCDTGFPNAYPWGGTVFWGNNHFRYNISEGDDYGWVCPAGTQCRGAFDLDSGTQTGTNSWHNNTIFTHAAANSSQNGTCFGNATGNAQNILIYNNICYNDSGNPFINTAQGAMGTLDYNDYFRTGTTPAAQWIYTNSNFASFAAWQGTGNDAHGKNVDPLFAGTAGTGGTCYVSGTPAGPQPCPSGYALNSGSPLIGIGANLTALFGFNVGTRDYFGNAVPNGVGSGYNIGADNRASSGAGPPVITAPTTLNVSTSVTTNISGLSLSEINPLGGETFTEVLSDATGVLTASGTGVVGSGTTTLTIGPTTLANVNSALATASVNTSASDTIHITAHDTISGGVAAAKDIVVTVIGSGVTYFVAANGSDSNNGTSSATPWLTIAHVNAATLGTNPTVQFRGGDTFSGGLVISNNNTTVTSYGTGQATISSGNSAACVTALNISGGTINNIICTGGGSSTNTFPGIVFTNNAGGTGKIPGPTITNNTVSGYGSSGILITSGVRQQSGFSNVLIGNNVVHDVGANSTYTLRNACIGVGFISDNLQSDTYGPPWIHTNVTVQNNLVFNCLTYSSPSETTGDGILVEGVNGGLLQFNVVHDIVGHFNYGIWDFNSTGLTYQFNEVYNVTSATATDSGPFDIDGGTANTVYQYNYGHHSDGPCVLMVGGITGVAPTSGNTFRYNICENNQLNASNANVGVIAIQSGTNAVAGTNAFYNNTIYQTAGRNHVFMGSGVNSGTVVVANNIFFSTGTTNVVSVTPSGTLQFNGNDYFPNTVHMLWNGTTYTSVAGFNAGTGQEANGMNVDPGLTTPGGAATCYSSGTPAGPQPCPGGYVLQAGSAMAGAGLNMNSAFGINPGARDYYNNVIPNGVGTGYNIGADGHNPGGGGGGGTVTVDDTDSSFIYSSPSNAVGASWVVGTNAVDFGGSVHFNNFCANNPPQLVGGQPLLVRGPMVAFNFRGTGVTLIGIKDTNTGIGAWSIDGGAKTLVDTFSASTLNRQPLVTITGLADTSHVLTYEATCTKNAASSNFYQVVDAASVTGSAPGGIAFASGSQGTWANATFNTPLDSCGASCAGNPNWTHGVGSTPTNLNATGSHAWSGKAGNTMTWTFTGSLIEVFTRPDTGGGFFTISIDGGPQSASILDYYDTVDNDGMTGYMTYAAKLSSGTHTIVLTTTGVNNPFGTSEASGQVALVQVDMFFALP